MTQEEKDKARAKITQQIEKLHTQLAKDQEVVSTTQAKIDAQIRELNQEYLK